MISAFFAAALIILSNLILVYLAKRYIEALIAHFLVSPGENEPSQLDILIERAAQKFTITLKMALLGTTSTIAREAKAVQGELAREAIGDVAPLAGMAIDQIPMLGKIVKKYPLLAMLAQSYMASKVAAPVQQSSPAPHNGSGNDTNMSGYN